MRARRGTASQRRPPAARAIRCERTMCAAALCRIAARSRVSSVALPCAARARSGPRSSARNEGSRRADQTEAARRPSRAFEDPPAAPTSCDPRPSLIEPSRVLWPPRDALCARVPPPPCRPPSVPSRAKRHCVVVGRGRIVSDTARARIRIVATVEPGRGGGAEADADGGRAASSPSPSSPSSSSSRASSREDEFFEFEGSASALLLSIRL